MTSAARKILRGPAFLARDGTLNRDDPRYIESWDVEWLPGAFDSVSKRSPLNARIIVITNQGRLAGA